MQHAKASSSDTYRLRPDSHGRLSRGRLTHCSSSTAEHLRDHVHAALVPAAERRGDHIRGVTTDDKAYCWGRNAEGQLGVGAAAGSGFYPRPIAVAGTHRFRSVRAGSLYTCGVTTGDVLLCWGVNEFGQLGDGTTITRRRPARVATGIRIREVEPGWEHTCAVSVGDIAYCWGRNPYGQLGDGTRTATRLTPVKVALHHFRMVSAGFTSTCGVTLGGLGYCWGETHAGQLGIGNTDSDSRVRPTAIAGGLTFKDIRVGFIHACGVTLDNKAYCWGANDNGELGSVLDNFAQRTPALVAGGLAFRALEAQYYRTCGVTTANAAYCWGVGALGPGTLGISETPALVPGGLLFRQVTPGHTRRAESPQRTEATAGMRASRHSRCLNPCSSSAPRQTPPQIGKAPPQIV